MSIYGGKKRLPSASIIISQRTFLHEQLERDVPEKAFLYINHISLYKNPLWYPFSFSFFLILPRAGEHSLPGSPWDLHLGQLLFSLNQEWGWGAILPQGDIWQCLETGYFPTWAYGRVCDWYPVGRGQGCCDHPAVLKTPYNREGSCPKSQQSQAGRPGEERSV